MLQEISRRIIHLSKYEDIDIVWHNNVLAVRCDSGIHLLDFSYNLKCLDKNIDFFESKVVTSKSSPAAVLFPQNSIKRGMKNIDLSRIVLDPSLWPHNCQLMEAAIITNFQWSPVDFIHNNESVLATVNSAGNVDLYAQERNKWSLLENLSLKLTHEMDSKIPNLIPPTSYNSAINFQKTKETAYALETISICWCPELNVDKSCYFVTAQKNGCILFWLLKCGHKCVDAILLHHTNQNKEEIVTMKWIPTSNNKFILVSSTVLGQIFAYQCQIENDVFEILSSYTLWAFKDKMVTHYIEYECLNDKILIVCNKHRHLVSLIIDKQCTLLFQNVRNVNDQRITSLVKNRGKFYTSTANREIYEVKFVIDNESLDTHLVPVEVKSISSASELHSFAFSTNNILLAMAMLDRTVLYRKQPMKLEIVLYTEETTDLEFNLIIHNPNKTLTNLWDVIETLRCKILKLKALPQFDYNKLYADAKEDIYYGKIFLIFLTLYNTLETTIQIGSRGILPETTVDIVKGNILACHAVELINKLCLTLDVTEDTPYKFEHHCVHMATMYLKEHCTKNKIKLNDLLLPDILKIVTKIKGPQYTCQSCDNIIKGFSCKDEHVNAFCSLTFTLIESIDYLVCRHCGAIATSEIYLDKPKCIFCDIYLCNCYLPI